MLTALQRLLFAPTLLESQLYPPLKRPVRFRTYLQGDRGSCIQIYQKNAAGRFPESQISEFEAYLDNESKTLIVAECDSKVVGYGGIIITSAETATLCYGIIDPAFQRQRIGATLTLLRIAQLPPHPKRIFVMILAVNASLPIYKRFGFVEGGKWKAKDGTEHPIGLLRVPARSLQTIKLTLQRRGIRVDGNISLHPSEEMTCQVEEGDRGAYRIRFRNCADGKTPAATNSE